MYIKTCSRDALVSLVVYSAHMNSHSIFSRSRFIHAFFVLFIMVLLTGSRVEAQTVTYDYEILVLSEGTAPGTGGTFFPFDPTLFFSENFFNLSVNALGDLTFSASFNTPGSLAPDFGIFKFDGTTSAIGPLIINGIPSAEIDLGLGEIIEFGAPTLNDGGKVLVPIVYENDFTPRVLVIDNEGGLTLLPDLSAIATTTPTPLEISFDSFELLPLNSSGATAVKTADGRFLFIKDDNTTTTIVREGDIVDGTTFATLDLAGASEGNSPLGLNNQGEVMFSILDSEFKSQIWKTSADGVNPIRVVREGGNSRTSVAGTQLVFDFYFDHTLSSQGRVAFFASENDEDGSSASTHSLFSGTKESDLTLSRTRFLTDPEVVTKSGNT